MGIPPGEDVSRRLVGPESCCLSNRAWVTVLLERSYSARLLPPVEVLSLPEPEREREAGGGPPPLDVGGGEPFLPSAVAV